MKNYIKILLLALMTVSISCKAQEYQRVIITAAPVDVAIDSVITYSPTGELSHASFSNLRTKIFKDEITINNEMITNDLFRKNILDTEPGQWGRSPVVFGSSADFTKIIELGGGGIGTAWYPHLNTSSSNVGQPAILHLANHNLTPNANIPSFKYDARVADGAIAATAVLAQWVTNSGNKMKLWGDGKLEPLKLKVTSLSTYADDTAAGTGGLVSGDVYKTTTGELRIKL